MPKPGAEGSAERPMAANGGHFAMQPAQLDRYQDDQDPIGGARPAHSRDGPRP